VPAELGEVMELTVKEGDEVSPCRQRPFLGMLDALAVCIHRGTELASALACALSGSIDRSKRIRLLRKSRLAKVSVIRPLQMRDILHLDSAYKCQ